MHLFENDNKRRILSLEINAHKQKRGVYGEKKDYCAIRLQNTHTKRYKYV
jgi:hypothetical protein